MLNLVNDILDVQKFEETEINLERDLHTVESLVYESVKQVKYLLEEKGIYLVHEIASHLQVKVDNELLVRVMVNLLTNAIKYSPLNSVILIKSKVTENGQLRISIVDNGKGISKE